MTRKHIYPRLPAEPVERDRPVARDWLWLVLAALGVAGGFVLSVLMVASHVETGP